MTPRNAASRCQLGVRAEPAPGDSAMTDEIVLNVLMLSVNAFGMTFHSPRYRRGNSRMLCR
jgi:hypothetical protein